MKRSQIRENAVSILYEYLISQKDIDSIIEDREFVSQLGDFITYVPLDLELKDALYRVCERFDIYKEVINFKLKKNWRFERLGKVEQSILLLALAELEQGIQDKGVIVNEAVELAKMYAEEDAYKLINAILDSL